MNIGSLIIKYYIYKALVAGLILAMTFSKSLLMFSIITQVVGFLILCKIMYDYQSISPGQISNKDSIALIVGVSIPEIVALCFGSTLIDFSQLSDTVRYSLIPVVLLFNTLLLAIAYSISKSIFESKDDLDPSYDS